MIRFFLSSGISKSLPIKIDQVAGSQKIVPIRLFSEARAENEIKGRFTFSEEEAKRGPALGSVQGHLPWVSEEQGMNEVQKEPRTEKSTRQTIQNGQKYNILAMKAIDVLAQKKLIKGDKKRTLESRVNGEWENTKKVHSG